ncbi:GNAT family N-acetyltransferase [Legionella sp. CNM-4043-24]|uniref:GNAT family N-acetyltransferase n=1 Tax=Legionella sp. CNM-4043-24 TaxID=3421646 RepID=UPI00403AC4AF
MTAHSRFNNNSSHVKIGAMMQDRSNEDMKKIIQLSGGDTLVISKAHIEDAAPVIDYLNRVGGESDFLTFGANGFPLTYEQEEEIIADCLSTNQCLMLVGKINQHIVAQLFLERSRNPRLDHIGEIGITVAQAWWGQSIGTHLLQSAIVWAGDNQISKLQLHVRSDHDSAIHLYKKQGFCIEGVITRAIKINDQYFDNYVMSLAINRHDME